eukprot:s2583_g6.t1
MARQRVAENADFIEIALRFSDACERRSFQPDCDRWDPEWQLEVALQQPIDDAHRTHLLRLLISAEDLALNPSEDLRKRFVRAVGRQLHIFESWTMFQLQELVHWDGGMRRLKEGITTWTLATLRCQMLPRKIQLPPLLLAKKWGLHFENFSGRLPGSLWRCILSFLACSFSWFESPRHRQAHPWWDWHRHPLVFPLFPSSPPAPPHLAKSVVGISLFLGEGSADECMHRQQLVSLTLNDVRFVQQNATREQLWDRLMMIGGNKSEDCSNDGLPPVTFTETLLCLAIFMRLKHGVPVLLLDFGTPERPANPAGPFWRRSLELLKEFDPEIAKGPLNSLVTLHCPPDVSFSRPAFLDALQRFLRAVAPAPPPRQLPAGLTLAVLRADASWNALELLSSLAPAVQLLDAGADGFSLGPRVAVLTAAAQDLNRMKPFRKDLLRQKLRSTLRMAAEHGDEALVLGAFGCGYFGNPPEAVAEVFQELLTSEFQGVFRLCVFALLRDRNYASFVRHFPVASHEDLKRLVGAVPCERPEGAAKAEDGAAKA